MSQFATSQPAGDMPQRPGSGRGRAGPGLMLFGALAALVLLFWLDPAKHGFFPRCAFNYVSGLECSGCGGQRAVHHLLHLEVARALQCNALLVLLLPLGLWQLARWGLRRTFGWGLPSPFRHHLWPWLLAAVVVVFGILRNLPAFDWLRP